MLWTHAELARLFSSYKRFSNVRAMFPGWLLAREVTFPNLHKVPKNLAGALSSALRKLWSDQK